MASNPFDQFDAPTDPGAALYEQAVKSYPYLSRSGLVATYSDSGGGNRKLEYWPSGEPGNAQMPRPANIPFDSPGVEVFDKSISPKDILADYVSHEAVNSDPELKRMYSEFAASVPDATMRKRYEYHKNNLGERRDYETWKTRSGMPEYFRGYTFDQWPDSKKFYSADQIAKLDQVRRYLGVDRQSQAGQNPFDQFDASASRPARTHLQELKRQLGLTARIGAEAIAALPLIPMDAGVGTRNLLTGSSYELPSATWQRGLNELLPQPETLSEKGVNIAGQMLIGSKLPAPTQMGTVGTAFRTPPPMPPANFSNASMRQLALQKAAKEGYAVPPSTVNPSMTNRVLESIGGKIAMEQDASIKNQAVTDALMKRSLGLDEATQMSEDVLPALRTQAAGPYKALRSVGTMRADSEYGKALDAISAQYRGAAKDFPELARDDIMKAVEAVRKPSFDADSAMDAIAILRDKASTAYGQGDKALGKAYREISGAMESAIERSLARRGKDSAGLLKEFRDARQLIAKTYSAESALNPQTGNFNASKLATQLAKGKPLSGEAKKVAEFATAFPKAAKLVLDSGSVRNTDVILGAGTAVMSREPTYLLYPFARQAVRQGLLSDAGQRVLTNPGLQPHPSTAMTLAYGTAAANGLLGQ